MVAKPKISCKLHSENTIFVFFCHFLEYTCVFLVVQQVYVCGILGMQVAYVCALHIQHGHMPYKKLFFEKKSIKMGWNMYE
jgi:hypothetical protein